MSAEKTFNTELPLPKELQEKAHILAGEPAWPPHEALQAVSWLGTHGYQVAGIELWQEKNAKPLWIGSSDYSPLSGEMTTPGSVAECAYQAALFIAKYQDHPDALFNLTWDPTPVQEINDIGFERSSRVRLLNDNYQSEGAHCFDTGYIIEVYPDGKYEVEFSDTDGTTRAQIVASEDELQVAPETYPAPSRPTLVNQIEDHKL